MVWSHPQSLKSGIYLDKELGIYVFLCIYLFDTKTIKLEYFFQIPIKK